MLLFKRPQFFATKCHYLLLFLTWLLRLLSIIWDGEPPEDWKKAIVIPIYKKGDYKDWIL
jgi:hypothetical protein